MSYIDFFSVADLLGKISLNFRALLNQGMNADFAHIQTLV
jgi:hypothetical protein